MRAIAFLWRPEQAAALAGVLTPGDRTIPLSQKSCAAAMAASLPGPETRYFEKVQQIDLAALRARADDAVRADEAAPGPSLDRPALWHDAHEAAYVAAAATVFLAGQPKTRVLCAAAETEPEAMALRSVCGTLGLQLECAPEPPTTPAGAPPEIPEDIRFLDAAHVADTRPWRLVVAVGLTDLPDQLRQAARGVRVVLAVDAEASGDAAAIQALARSLGNVRVLSLAADGERFDERGDNTPYARVVEKQLARAFVSKPVDAIVADLRRVETAVAVRFAKEHSVPVILRAHGGGVSTHPYRFEDGDGVRSVWTRGAAVLEGAHIVACPQFIRPSPARRAARLALRARRLFGRRRLGIVITSGELFAAPEAHLAPMLNAFAGLAREARDADIVVRMRRLEDSESVWRAALPHVEFAAETLDDRPFFAFARDCDLLVELGAESSAFLEAAANAVAYVRCDAPPSWLRRFARKPGLVPELSSREIAALLRSPARTVALGLRQFLAVAQDTRPT